MIELYGIAQCSTVKKARLWLDSHEISYEFHDFKKSPPTEQWLKECAQAVGIAVLLNKRGTTWRTFSPEQQAQALDFDGAISLMQHNPSVIKRPVLRINGNIYVGFAERDYETIFSV